MGPKCHLPGGVTWCHESQNHHGTMVEIAIVMGDKLSIYIHDLRCFKDPDTYLLMLYLYIYIYTYVYVYVYVDMCTVLMGV